MGASPISWEYRFAQRLTRRTLLRTSATAGLSILASQLLNACRGGTQPTPGMPEQGGTPMPAPAQPTVISTPAGSTGKILELYHDKANWTDNVDAVGQLAANRIGIGFKSVPYPDTTTYQTTVRQSLGTDRPPDLFTWWSGYRMEDIVKSGAVEDLSTLWDKYIKSGEYSPDIASAYTFDNRVYAVPFHISYWVVFYNKSVFEQHSLKVPTTWDEFLGLCDTLKKKGVTPLAQTVDGRWPAFILFEELVLRSAGPDFYNALMNGHASYESPEVVQAMDIWKDMIGKGYFTDPGISFGTGANTLLPLFSQGQVAMIPIGDWYQTSLLTAGLKPGTDYDAFVMPNVKDDIPPVIIFETGPLLVSSRGPNKADALKVVDWWMSAEAQQEWTQRMGFAPPNSKVKSDNPVVANIVNTVVSGGYKLIQRYWEATPPDIVEPAVDELGKFILNPETGPEVRAAIQRIADRVWQSRRR